VFRWFNRFLKGEQPLIEMAAKKFFTPEQLRVFDKLPADAVNTNIQSLFVPKAKPLAEEEMKRQRASLLTTLQEQSFGGWPVQETPLDAKAVFSVEREGLKFSAWDFMSQRDIGFRLYLLESAARKPAESVALHVLDPVMWPWWLGAMRVGFAGELREELDRASGAASAEQPGEFGMMKSELAQSPVALAFFAPRGVGLTAWTGDAKKQTQIRRRFMLLGQTLDGMRVWDIRRAVQTIHFVREGDTAKIELRAAGAMSSQAQLAALFEPSVRKLEVEMWREPEAGGADYLNLLKVLDAGGVSRLNSMRSQRP
jgi:hypothetical protein